MPSFSQVILLGNVTRDPQMKAMPNGNNVTDFGMAVNRKYRTASGEDKEETCFVDCTAFGKQAEVIAQYVSKGKPLFVEGRLKFDQWEDKTGGKRSKLTVVVNNFQFIGGRDGGDGEGGQEHRPVQRQQPAPQGQQKRSYPPAQVRPAAARNQAQDAWGNDSAEAPF